MNKTALKVGGTLFAIFIIFMTWGVSTATDQDAPEDTILPNAAALPDNFLFLPSIFRNHPKDTIFGYEWSSISTSYGLNEMAEAGASWVRRAGIWWPDVEPTKGNYNWGALSGFETEFIRARDNNMKVVIIVRGTPDWAWADAPFNESCGRIKESEFASYATFVAELVRRYSGPPYYVKYWELGNEPEIDPRDVPPEAQWMGCWGNKDEPLYGGAYYANMLKVVYPAMKAVDSSIRVLIGGMLLDCDYNIFPSDPVCQSIKFFEGILDNGGGPYFDGVSFHAYDYYLYPLGAYRHLGWSTAWNTTGPVVFAKANWLNSKLSYYGVSGKFLMNTEAALLCDTAWGICDTDFETTKAYYVVHTYVAAMAKGLEGNLWYFWMYRNSGLLESDLDPLPAYNAYKFARNELRDATYNQEITGDPGVRIYELNNRGGRIWVLWSLDGTTHTGFSLGGTPAAIYDVYGNPVAVSSSIDVGLMPLYVEWDT